MAGAAFGFPVLGFGGGPTGFQRHVERCLDGCDVRFASLSWRVCWSLSIFPHWGAAFSILEEPGAPSAQRTSVGFKLSCGKEFERNSWDQFQGALSDFRTCGRGWQAAAALQCGPWEVMRASASPDHTRPAADLNSQFPDALKLWCTGTADAVYASPYISMHLDTS